MQMFSQNQSSDVETLSRQFRLLSRLPKLSNLPNRKPTSFEGPAFPAVPEITSGFCTACKRSIEEDNDFLQNLKICRQCLDVHSAVEAAINRRADEKARAVRLENWQTKGGAEHK